MNLRLAYRIVSQAVRPPVLRFTHPGFDYAVLSVRLKAEAELIARSPKFTLDNVAAFYAEHPQQEWTLSEDFPNWAPPFQRFFVEWSHPAFMLASDGRHSMPGGQSGYFCLAMNVSDETRGNVDLWSAMIEQLAGFRQQGGIIPRDEWRSLLPSSRWIYWLSSWSTSFAHPVCGAPIWSGINHVLFIDQSGRCFRNFAVGFPVAHIAELFGADAIFSPLHILGLGLSFCHCKNVKQSEEEIGTNERWHRRAKVPRYRFYTLNINPMRETLRKEGQSEESGIKRALHICRGHFATYDADHPLFGRYVGTFWRPDHVRGSRDHGEVVKDYSVKL